MRIFLSGDVSVVVGDLRLIGVWKLVGGLKEVIDFGICGGFLLVEFVGCVSVVF